MTATTSPTTRGERLDRLPVTREHGRLVFGSGLGWARPSVDCSPTGSAAARSSP